MIWWGSYLLTCCNFSLTSLPLKPCFHVKGFAPGLVLKQRSKGTWKRPFVYCVDDGNNHLPRHRFILSPQEPVWDSIRKIPYWWRSSKEILVVTLIGWCSVLIFGGKVTTNQRRYTHFCRATSSVWNFFSRAVEELSARRDSLFSTHITSLMGVFLCLGSQRS